MMDLTNINDLITVIKRFNSVYSITHTSNYVSDELTISKPFRLKDSILEITFFFNKSNQFSISKKIIVDWSIDGTLLKINGKYENFIINFK